jgi:octaprenyl-diphosphate synthase
MVQAWDSIITGELDSVESRILSLVHSDNPELDEMCRYVVTSGGKRIRPAMCILSYYACGGKDPSRAIDVGAAFEIVHSASLIHDDINDKSEIRRGRKVLYRQYCVSKAIVAGDFMMAKGFQALGSSSRDIVDVIVEAASHMSESEFVQKKFQHRQNVTEDDYYEIIRGKTAMLINACAKSGAYLAGAKNEVIEIVGSFATSIGMAFQIIDDILDVVGQQKSTGKRAGVDLIEGTPTLPTIFAMHDITYGAEVRKIFSREEPTEDDVAEALELIKKTDSLERCRQKAESFADSAIEQISKLPRSVYSDAMDALARFIVDRDR